MAIHENVYPGPQKEKYVIRRLLRRAVLDGHQMGVREPFLYKLVPVVVEMMKPAYPELAETARRVADVIRERRSQFLRDDRRRPGPHREDLRRHEGSQPHCVDGGAAADLYQTYGVPPEVFETMAAENNLAFDWDGYRRAMREHGEASGKVVHTVMGDKGPIDAIKKVLHETPFLGYETTESLTRN